MSSIMGGGTGVDVAEGNVATTSFEDKFGRNPNVDTGSEDIWDFGGTYTWPIVSQLASHYSSDSADDADGEIGATQMKIFGLDIDYQLTDLIVPLQGLTEVSLSTKLLRIHRMYITIAGSEGKNIGTISLRMGLGGPIVAQIKPGNNQSLMTQYTVPDGFNGYIQTFYASLIKPTGVTSVGTVFLKIRKLNSVFRVQRVVGVSHSGNSFITVPIVIPIPLPPKTDVTIEASVDQNNTDIAAGYTVLLRKI